MSDAYKVNISEFGKELEEFKENKESEVVNFIETWTQKIEAINEEIKVLLPKALTAGLSYAYSEKKKDEVGEGTKHSKSFHQSILYLVIISLIPFVVNIVRKRHSNPTGHVRGQ